MSTTEKIKEKPSLSAVSLMLLLAVYMGQRHVILNPDYKGVLDTLANFGLITQVTEFTWQATIAGNAVVKQALELK